VFGAAQAFSINLQLFRDAIPPSSAFCSNHSVVGMVPYLSLLLILTGIIGKTTRRAADGLPYDPEGAHDARARSPRDHQKYPGVCARTTVSTSTFVKEIHCLLGENAPGNPR